MSKLIPFPVRSCEDCARAAHHPAGIYCTEYREFVREVNAAEACVSFDRLPPIPRPSRPRRR